MLAVYLVLGFFYYLKAQSESAKETVDGRPGSVGLGRAVYIILLWPAYLVERKKG